MITREQALFWEITKNDHQRFYLAFCFVSCGYRDDGSRSWNHDEVYLLVVFSSTVFFDYDNDNRDSNDNDIQPLFPIFSLFLLDLPDQPTDRQWNIEMLRLELGQPISIVNYFCQWIWIIVKLTVIPAILSTACSATI